MKKIIITGSRGLIGSEFRKHCQRRGLGVIECDLKLGHDLTNEAFVKDWFSKNKAGSLVNFFAMNDHVDHSRSRSNIFNVSLKSFNDYLNVNLTSLFSVCREFARHNKKGTIVNFSSTYGVVAPYPDLYDTGEKHIGYSVSKAGVIQLTRHLSVFLAPQIRVNCIVPGGVLHQQGQEFRAKYAKRVPMHRMMKARELNGITEYLCSEESSYVTGGLFFVDGGWTAW